MHHPPGVRRVGEGCGGFPLESPPRPPPPEPGLVSPEEAAEGAGEEGARDQDKCLNVAAPLPWDDLLDY